MDPWDLLAWNTDSLNRLSMHAAPGAQPWAATVVVAVFASEHAALAAEQDLVDNLAAVTGLACDNLTPWPPGRTSRGGASHYAVYLQLR